MSSVGSEICRAPLVIELENISKSFDDGETYAVKDMSFTVPEGETVVLVGTSGCGKTTTLKMINRLVEPTSGVIRVDEQNVLEQDPVALRRSIGYVFQGIGLFPHLSIVENVAVVPRLEGWPKSKRRQRAKELLDLVDLPPDEFADRMPPELSGGQQQRVGVARALATDPKYLLMDEPFGALDAITRDALQQELLDLKERLDKTIIFVTHDIFEALTLADHLAVMHDGDLQQFGSPKEIANEPANEFVESLFHKPARQLAEFQEHF